MDTVYHDAAASRIPEDDPVGVVLMENLAELPYASWLEKTLSELIEFKPSKIALAAINSEGEYATGYYDCQAIDLFTMAGALHMDGVWKELEANSTKLREIIEEGGPDND